MSEKPIVEPFNELMAMGTDNKELRLRAAVIPPLAEAEGSPDRIFMAENTEILITKLQVPLLPSHLVPRPLLMQRLDAAIQRKLTLVSASAGSGKTTTLGEWVACSSRPVAWISLDESDNDPSCFWGYVIAALGNIQPEIGEAALALLRSPQTPPIEAVITALINSVAVIAQDFTLIIDDYHLITTPAIHEGLLFLLKHLPARMHLLVASRTDPPFPLPRLRASYRLVELRGSDLRFTRQEVVALFSRLTGSTLAEEHVEKLEMLTEGWITGLQLAALSAQCLPDLATFLETFTGNDLYIFDYLANEVWQKLPRSMQVFLLKAALPERLNTSLCATLTGKANCQRLLEQLETANLFLVRLDNQRHWYRFHHLFREFLLAHLPMLSADKVKELHLRACLWYEQHGLVNEAIQHALRADDPFKAAALIMNAGPKLVRRNEATTLTQWLDALPEDFFSIFPRLSLFRGWLFIMNGQVLASQQWLRRAQQGIDNNALSPLPHTEQELALIAGELAILHSHVTIFLGDIPRSLALANQALKLIPEDDLFLRSLGELNLGVANWLDDNLQAASWAMTRAENIGQVANNLYVRLMASCILVHIQVEQGHLQRGLQLCQRALQLAQEQKGESLSATAVLHISRGQIFYWRNELHEAELALQEGIALCKRWEHRDLMIYCYTVMAQIKRGQRDMSAAWEMAQLAAQSVRVDQPYYWMASAITTLQIQLAVALQNFALIEQWQLTEMCSYVNIFEQQALAQIALAQQQPEKALDILEKVFRHANEVGRVGALIDIRVLQTLAHQQLQATDQALRTLAQALEQAEPERIISPFLDAGPALRELLMLLVAEKKALEDASCPVDSAFVHTVLAAFGEPAPMQTAEEAASEIEAGRSERAEKLRINQREIEIIRLIVDGLSTQEIARRVIITENTVKWYVKNIYSKLQVHNRAQLVVQARELGIE